MKRWPVSVESVPRSGMAYKMQWWHDHPVVSDFNVSVGHWIGVLNYAWQSVKNTRVDYVICHNIIWLVGVLIIYSSFFCLAGSNSKNGFVF